MSAKVFSAAVIGMDCQLVEVEADTAAALPGIFIVGLPDKSVDESRERVRSALKNSDLEIPRKKVTINLAPADLKKVGPAYDLPIAISILQTSGQLPHEHDSYTKSIFIGELALDGTVRPVNGVLSVCLFAKRHGLDTIFLPQQNAHEASLVSGLRIYPCENLKTLVAHLREVALISEFTGSSSITSEEVVPSELDFQYIKGQQQVKRAFEIAAAGGHNILLSGPPGSGKTMLAKSMVGILPVMTQAESLEVTRIYSVAGLLPEKKPLITTRPFRCPHHTASGVSLVGGGSWPKPGEISLAHRGVLFLDEFPEFPRAVLENLRQPLEDGIISVSRASGTMIFPAKFILVAAMNPCPCGYLSDPDRTCVCMPAQIIRYQKKISGPLIDRIDLHCEVPKVKFEKLTGSESGETSATIRTRVQAARDVQLARFKDCGIFTNTEMSSRLTNQFCSVDTATAQLLRTAVSQFNISARSYFRILKIARTIADLAHEEMIRLEHVAEALQYRPKID